MSEPRESAPSEVICQVMELLLRPGPGQCDDPTIAHAVLSSLMAKHGIEREYVDE